MTTKAPLASSLSPAPAASDFSSFISVLFSLSALHDWLKLIIIGGLLETCRRLVSIFYQKADELIFITATFEEGDQSYNWIIHWLSKHPSWSEARRFRVSSKSFGLRGVATTVPGEESDANALVNGKRKLAYLPATSTTTTIWYKHRWMRVSRFEQEVQNDYFRNRVESLEIKILTRNKRVLNELLLEAKKAYLAAQADTISVYVSGPMNTWRQIASRPKRPLGSIILDPGMKDGIVADAKDFLASKAWYAARGIPFRRGYLLYGAPGSGKTSIIHSLAGELGLDIYVISLSRSGLDDTGLTELISNLPEQCIALMEDIDAALTQRINRESNDSDDKLSNAGDGQGSPAPTACLSRVSLSGLLNALDGVGAQEGRILFATTNKYSALDPALCRPGRMDVHVEFKLASKVQARQLYEAFYMPESSGKMEEEEDVGGQEDSGYASKDETFGEKSNDTLNLIDLSAPSENESIAKVDADVTVTGLFHQRRAPRLSQRTVATLADLFADAIPERQVSMAALQGYLMIHKARPMEAARDAKSWVEKETAVKKR
ncbi:hypothetical protein AX17_001767 [Amanita inopinata Kibby_2008]|nr:hypothetical protein AX17_001767 [Amanita inopinata Kibby_2008]